MKTIGPYGATCQSLIQILCVLAGKIGLLATPA